MMPARTPDGPRVHGFFFYNGRIANMTLRPHHIRDGLPYVQLLAPLIERGYAIGKPWLNFPPIDGNDRTIVQLDLSTLRRGDLVVVVTRPPLDDMSDEDRITIERGYTNLEEIVFLYARGYFDVLRRSYIRLHKDVVEQLPKGFENRAEMVVRVLKGCAWYTELRRVDGTWKRPKERRTPVFLARWNEVPELGGADLLLAFGQGGSETLAFAHRLSTDLQHLLDEPGFTFAELVLPPMEGDAPAAPLAPERTFDLDFADQAQVEVILRLR